MKADQEWYKSQGVEMIPAPPVERDGEVDVWQPLSVGRLCSVGRHV